MNLRLACSHCASSTRSCWEERSLAPRDGQESIISMMVIWLSVPMCYTIICRSTKWCHGTIWSISLPKLCTVDTSRTIGIEELMLLIWEYSWNLSCCSPTSIWDPTSNPPILPNSIMSNIKIISKRNSRLRVPRCSGCTRTPKSVIWLKCAILCSVQSWKFKVVPHQVVQRRTTVWWLFSWTWKPDALQTLIWWKFREKLKRRPHSLLSAYRNAKEWTCYLGKSENPLRTWDWDLQVHWISQMLWRIWLKRWDSIKCLIHGRSMLTSQGKVLLFGSETWLKEICNYNYGLRSW